MESIDTIKDKVGSEPLQKSPAIALIFAGGSGRRMNNGGVPKQFLELKGKPIIVYTLEHFQKHPEIDAIVVVSISTGIEYLKSLVAKYSLDKVKYIVPGGETGQDSIYEGLKTIHEHFPEDSIVLIHDGVRPLIDAKTISGNIEGVRKYGSCITCVPTIETFVVQNQNGNFDIPERKDSLIARAPQSFVLRDIFDAHNWARDNGRHDYIDSCSLMNSRGYNLHTILGPLDNIKITTPMDYFIFKTLVDVHEVQQVFGF